MTKDEALKRAIEYLECPTQGGQKLTVINACKKALEQPAQEPVAWIKEVEVLYMKAHKADGIMNWKTNLGLKPEPDDIPLYTHPHQWQGLSINEEDNFIAMAIEIENGADAQELVLAIEQALKEKNT